MQTLTDTQQPIVDVDEIRQDFTAQADAIRRLDPGMQMIDSGLDANMITSDIAGYERSVCGAMYVYPESMISVWRAKVGAIPNPGNALFFFDRTRAFFKNALMLHKRGLNIDPVTMARELPRSDLEAMGGLAYAIGHVDFCFSLEASVNHLDAMIRAYKTRQFREICQIAAETSTSIEDLNSTIALLNEQATKLLTTNTELITPTEDLCVDVIERLTIEKDSSSDIPTSFRSVADFVGDYKRGQITLIGAPPGNGKTAYAMQEIECALKHSFIVDAFLMESSFDQFSERYLMRNYAIRGGKFKSKFFTVDDHRGIQEGMEALTHYKNRLHMAPMENYTVADVDAFIQKRKNETGLPCDMIVIDHLATMSHPQERGMSQYEASKRTVHQLRSLAARENAVLLLMDQLSVEAIRNSFNGGSKLPTIAAFRGGTPVESAKVVMILHKDEQDMLRNDSPVVEQRIVICKANDGQTGYVRSLFLKPFAMHVEDTSLQQRHEHAKWLDALHYPLDTRRKDVK